ncbi:MAG: NADH:flavin oxidoreductase/NADH oxidase [Nitrospirae bacterium]|nr:NADH:flavin oxidoreductase/NADH oxidase [Nitrospirota bacterium]
MSQLFTPLQLGPLELTNRIVVSPMCQYSADDGVPGDWHMHHLMQLGCSGAGLVMVEATAVERRGRITHGCLGLYSDSNEAALGRVMSAVRRIAGQTRFGIQLAHAGRKASANRPWVDEGRPLAPGEDPWPTVGPSSSPYVEGWPIPEALDKDGMQRIIAAFSSAAARAARIGFEVVEVHAAHGYLLHEFLSPFANMRTDSYGGDFNKRMRFPLEVVGAVRAALPAGIVLGVRITGTDWLEGGLTLDDAVVFANELRSLGVGYACVSSGGITRSVKVPVGPGYQVPLAERVKKESGIAVRAVGMILTPEQAEDIVSSGKADMVCMARAFLDDPRWVWHAAEKLGASIQYPPQYERAQRSVWRGADVIRPGKK